MQNVYLMEQLAAQRRAEWLAEAERQRLAAAARFASRTPSVRREPAGMAAAFVFWCSARLAAPFGVQMSKRRESCRECH